MKAVHQVVQDAWQHWVGDGFPVRSLLSYAGENRFDPFLLLDYAGPHTFEPASTVRGVAEHPHRGFETVTIVYQGELAHRDSTGSHGTIGPGDVQWMTAASGVVHEEFHSERFTRSGGTLEMVQLWVNLPASEKMRPPRYQGLLKSGIPEATLPDDAGTVRVIAGQFEDTHGPAETFTPVDVWDVQIARGGTFPFTLPDGHTALVLVQAGTARVNAANVAAIGLVELERSGTEVIVETDDAARLLFLSGAPINEPVVGQGPFVMNTRDEIRQAIEDFREGRIGRIESPDE
ncbi:MAG: pirin family protein [Maioricimonas sp. JB045]